MAEERLGAQRAGESVRKPCADCNATSANNVMELLTLIPGTVSSLHVEGALIHSLDRKGVL
jgi:hypothetical protein